jgi:hypothetical protein
MRGVLEHEKRSFLFLFGLSGYARLLDLDSGLS